MPGRLNTSAGRKGRPWRRIQAEVRSWHGPCTICGDPIDYNLPYNHPDAFTVEHRLPRELYPHLSQDLANLAPAHRRCNSSKGASLTRPPPTSRRVTTSRPW